MSEQPLLPPGVHDVSVAELDKQFLNSFSNSSTRAELIAGLRRYVDCLAKFGIRFEIWIDGSFVTHKENPNDVDLVAFASSSEVNCLSADFKRQLRGLFDRISVKQAFKCDVLFAPIEDMNVRSYWRGWYGFDRSENPKGIARLVIES
jgi:hypothetical protein